MGDAGVAERGRSPLLRRISEEVDQWAETLPAGSVAVTFLGDNVYPVGIRDGGPERAQDSTRLWSQVEVVATDIAVDREVVGLFTPGNHDWGNMVGEEGRERLANEEAMLTRAGEQGIRVELLPSGGLPGPSVRDLGSAVRLVFIDTHWLLQEPGGDWQDGFFAEVASALRGADGRRVVMLAHHPLRSAGPHGALVPAMDAMGLLYLFKKSGTLIQDLNSPVFSVFLGRLREAFARGGGPPLVLAGGHDHSLQVLSPLQPGDPPHLLVSGAGSKLTDISAVPGLRMGVSQPGFMELLFLRGGGVQLRVFAAGPGDQHCPVGIRGLRSEAARARLGLCLERSAAAFRVIYAEDLKPVAGR